LLNEYPGVYVQLIMGSKEGTRWARIPENYFRRLFWSVLLSGGSPAYGGRYPVLHAYDQTAGREWRLDNNQLAFDEQLVGLDHIAHIKEYLTRRSIDVGAFGPDDADSTFQIEPFAACLQNGAGDVGTRAIGDVDTQDYQW
jgi:hypothetical protein